MRRDAYPTRPPQQRRCRCGGWMLLHRVAQRSYPQGKYASMKWVFIIEIWY
jgi:hypothetical protein